MYDSKARFFIMKSFDVDTLKVSIEQNVWCTTPGPTRKFNEIFQQKGGKNVYLIFSVNESGGYQGFARMKGKSDDMYKPNFKKQSEEVFYDSNFPVQWKTKLMYYPFKNL